MDGATDTANMEEELFLAVYFEPYSEDGSVHVRNKYFLCKTAQVSRCIWSV